MKYTYSRTIVTHEGSETFTAVDCASFDEAQKFVEKGIYDRRLQLQNYAATAKPAPIDLASTLSPKAGPNSGTIVGNDPTGNVPNSPAGHQGQH